MIPLDFDALEARIRHNLLAYVATRSDSATPHERNVEAFWQAWAGRVPYLQAHPDHWGLDPIPGDPLGRHVCWSLLRGEGRDTVVLIHHSDCVGTEGYQALEPLSLDPPALEAALRGGGHELPAEAEADLNAGDWIFGRGVCDMKGGASVQLALFEHYSADPDFKGNLVLLAVPDEENLSAGMRSACTLLERLAGRHGLEYVLMLNCEPHEREDPRAGALYDGSIGKLLPIVYVRGQTAHVGHVFQGFSPLPLLSEIIGRTDLNPFFIERAGNTVCPPCTWLYGRDLKGGYDVTLPPAASGCLSVLPLTLSPKAIMEKLHALCLEAFAAVIDRMNRSYRVFSEASGLPPQALPWRPRVCFFSQLFEAARQEGGQAFLSDYDARCRQIGAALAARETDTVGAANLLIEAVLRHVSDPSPVVVLALAPPYYPAVNNRLLGERAARADGALGALLAYGRSLGEDYRVLNYFVAISDLSYAMLTDPPESRAYIEENMLLWGDYYHIPLQTVADFSMPVCNIGPWGKDLHRKTERVNSRDLYAITPRLVDFMIGKMLGHGPAQAAFAKRPGHS